MKSICTVEQLVNLLKPIPKNYVIKADDFAIKIIDEEKKTVAFICPQAVSEYKKIKLEGEK